MKWSFGPITEHLPHKHKEKTFATMKIFKNVPGRFQVLLFVELNLVVNFQPSILFRLRDRFYCKEFPEFRLSRADSDIFSHSRAGKHLKLRFKIMLTGPSTLHVSLHLFPKCIMGFFIIMMTQLWAKI